MKSSVSIKKIGHKGACGYEPENTMRSFKKAIDIGVDMIELDVHCCKSGEIVVIHDERVNRTTNGNGFVKDLTLEELKKFDAGKGEQIPRLQQVFDLICNNNNRKVKVIVELKGKKTAEAVALLIDEYVENKKLKYDDFIVISFDHDQVLKFKGLCPKTKVGLLFRNFDLFTNKILKLKGEKILSKFDYMIPNFKFITKEVVEKIHNEKLKIFVYTVNKIQDIQKMKDFFVDGIISDYPDLV